MRPLQLSCSWSAKSDLWLSMFVPKRGAERCATGWVQELLVDVCVFGHASCLLPAIAPEWQLSMHKNVFMCLAVLGIVTCGVACVLGAALSVRLLLFSFG